jgi:hypothetical protein
VEDERGRSQEVESVFGLGRRKPHRELVRAELGQSLGHFRQAAHHAADGVGTTVGPRVTAARGYVGPATLRARNGWERTVVTVTPMAVAALNAARQTSGVGRKAAPTKAELKSMKAAQKKKSRGGSRRPSLPTLLAAGAALGAAAAFVVRRRNQPRWDEYDPAQALDAVRSDAKSSGAGEATSSGSTADSATRTTTDPSGIAFTDTTSRG